MKHALYLFVILPFLFFSCGDIVLEEAEDTSTLPNDTNTSENPTDMLHCGIHVGHERFISYFLGRGCRSL